MHAFWQSIHSLIHTDITLFYRINRVWTNPLFDWVMPRVSDPNLFMIPIGIGVLALLIWGRFRERLFLLLMLLEVSIGDAGITNFGKQWIHRPRPHEVLTGVRLVDRQGVHWSEPVIPSRGRSFPSGHASNNVGLAVMACALYGRRARWLWLWAVLVSYSRIYLGAHYPSDILGSWLLSILYCRLILAALEALWKWQSPRWFPRLAATHPTLRPPYSEVLPHATDCKSPAHS